MLYIKMKLTKFRLFLLETPAYSIFLNEEVLKLKRLSIFFAFIFLVSILPVNYHHHECSIYQDDSPIFKTVDDNSDFLSCDIYQVPSNARFITTIITAKNVFAPYILTFKFLARSPPV